MKRDLFINKRDNTEAKSHRKRNKKKFEYRTSTIFHQHSIFQQTVLAQYQ